MIELVLGAAGALLLIGRNQRQAGGDNDPGGDSGSLGGSAYIAPPSARPASVSAREPSSRLSPASVSNREMYANQGGRDEMRGAPNPQGGAAFAGVLGGMVDAGKRSMGRLADAAFAATPAGRVMGVLGVTASGTVRSVTETVSSGSSPAAVTNSQSSAFADDINAEAAMNAATVDGEIGGTYAVDPEPYGGYGVNDYGGGGGFGGGDAGPNDGGTGPQ